MFVKDVKRISNRQVKKMVIVSNNLVDFGEALENGIPVLSYKGEFHDRELLFLEEYLVAVHECDDIR